MIKIEYSQTDYGEAIKQIARLVDVKIKDDTIFLPEKLGSGSVSFYQLADLQVLVSDYFVKEDLVVHRKKCDKEFFILRFDVLTDKDQKSKNAIFLTNTKFEAFFFTTPETYVKSIVINLNKKWLEHYFSLEATGEDIHKFLALKVTSAHFEVMDNEARHLFGEFMSVKNEGIKKMVLYNRVMLLIEHFFSKIYKKASDTQFDIKLTKDEIVRIKQVEATLVSDFSMPPPNIQQLSKTAAMSPSKLKIAFKEMFGLPVYQYYQKHRMQKAKAMLLSKKYTLKEVGYEVGYSNLNNFFKAFQKIFDQLPVELIN